MMTPRQLSSTTAVDYRSSSLSRYHAEKVNGDKRTFVRCVESSSHWRVTWVGTGGSFRDETSW